MAGGNPAPLKAGRALIYLRVSELMGRGGDDFYSPEMQLSANRQAVNRNGLVEIGVVDDDIDQTGRTFDREGIAKIRRLVEGGHVDALVCYDIKRFGRNVYEGLGFARWLDERGVRIVSASENIDTSTPSGRWMFRELLSMAEYQSDEIGQYWARTIAARAQNGLAHARTPAGYVKRDRLLVPDPAEGPIWMEAFRRFGAGYPVWDICQWLHIETGRGVTPGNFKARLKRPVYRGLVVHNKKELPGAHEPLMDDHTWELVSKRLKEEAGQPPRTKSEATAWSLRHLIYHDEGHPEGAGRRVFKYPERGVNRLVCGGVKRRVPGGCDGIGAPRADEVVAYVLDEVAGYIRLLETDPALAARVSARRSSAVADAGRLKAQLGQVRAAMGKLALRDSLGEVPERAYHEAMGELVANERALEAALREAEAMAGEPSPAAKLNAAKETLRLWPDLLEHERNRLLKKVVRRVIIRRAARWREPIDQRVEVLMV